MNELISIVMSCYNGEDYLEDQLNSIIHQSYTNFELLICDDCSIDNTYKILLNYSTKDKRIKLFRNEENQGFINSFQRLLYSCKGDYIALCDQDDVWTEDHLDILYNEIQGYDLVGANSELVNKELESLGVTMLESLKVDYIPQTQREWFLSLLHMNVFQGTACMLKRKLVSKILPIPNGVQFHDRWFAVIASMDGGVNYVDKVILQYRQHGKNVTNNKKWSFINKIKETLKNREKNTYIDNQLLFLDEVLKKTSEEDYIELINEAKNFYLSINNDYIKVFRYYLKYYKLIYLSKSKYLKIIRIFKRAINL